ncbi:unnamed protein product [Paramecium sonneborni]|uniref:Protein kinase domain-containing protein n=1 Tax=Paramecium sonneborni TaxID=65129 RepID=A0A8S1KLQ2_9CILI|nr:unnamed protein product [Paramecium sonneborni]
MDQKLQTSGPLSEQQVSTLFYFLDKEKRKIIKNDKNKSENSHIRTLTWYGMKDSKLEIMVGEKQAESLEEWLKNQRSINYWDILSQLLQGIYQIHKLGFIGRCIRWEDIRVVQGILIYKNFGYCDRLVKAPENVYLKFSTFETDLWLVGAIMWKIVSKKNIYDENQGIDPKNINLTFNFNVNDSGLDPELYELLKQMLQIYQIQRIPLPQIFQHKKLNLTIEQKQVMSEFYKNFQLKHLLSQRKNQFKRNYLIYIQDIKPLQLFFYYLEECSILKYFYQTYLEIQLLNLAYHISFYFPNQNQNILNEINTLIIKKIVILSSNLKQQILFPQLPIQFRGQEEKFINDPYYKQLKQKIVEQQNKLDKINDQMSQNNEFLTIQDINSKFNSYTIDGIQSIMSILLVNILKKSFINQKDFLFIKSMTLEEMFEYEVKERLI